MVGKLRIAIPGYRRYSKDNPAANRMLITIRATSTARSRMELAASLGERPQPSGWCDGGPGPLLAE